MSHCLQHSLKTHLHPSTCTPFQRQRLVSRAVQHHPRNVANGTPYAAAACPEAQCAQWGVQTATKTQTGCLVRNRVLKNPKGLFRIRHLQQSDLNGVAQLQAACFHEALPLKPLDELAFTMFRAEVLSAVQKKTKVLAEDGFTILVVESCNPGASSWLAGGGDDSSNSSDWDAAVWYGDHQTAPDISWDAAVSGGAANSNILGVIEVGIQDEQDVLQHLPSGIQTYAYVSSMAVAPQLRRCGIGAALLQAAEQQAAMWEQGVVALHVYETNHQAIKLYQSHGLMCHASDPAWRKYVGGKVRQLMVKWL